MKLSLRARYFRSLVRLLLITYGLFALILLAFNLYEWHEHGHQREEELEELLGLLGLMAVTFPAVLWAAWRIAGQLLSPLRQVAATAERIRAGNLQERIPEPEQRDELARVVASLNHAFDRYADGVARLERFNADASHQLRTPLAALRATAEVCLQQDRDPEAYRETLGQILEETARMQHTVDQLLQLARLDPALLRAAERLDLRAAVAGWMDDARLLTAARGISLHGPDGAPAWITAHPLLLREVFLNLFSNALAATPEGGVIRVQVESLPAGRVAWTVEDSGPGIPPEERVRVFDRFFRGHATAPHGAGLGLSIVSQIVALHRGAVEIDASPSLGGARLRILLPAA
jgi:signal transduction histidine kinase